MPGCSEKPLCLIDEKDIGEVLAVEDLCYRIQGRNAPRQDCDSISWSDLKHQRIKIKREIDNTICISTFHKSWLLKVGDKIRGPL